MNEFVIGIDATNLRQGGGRTHLIELLRAADPVKHNFSSIIVWGSKSTLRLLDDKEWLIKRNPKQLEAGLLRRSLWQRFSLSNEARREGCDVLFVPGGTYTGDFSPVVTMSQNLLPFEWKELWRYGFSLLAVKFLLLRFLQARSFKKSNGVIFLTNYAKKCVEKVTGPLNGNVAVVPHGLNPRFLSTNKSSSNINYLNKKDPVRLIYVSSIEPYKHHSNVLKAVKNARKLTGIDFQLDLIGPANEFALARLQSQIEKIDCRLEWAHYHGEICYDLLSEFYNKAHIGLFASSCENLPLILLETMASEIPVLSSDRGPMPEVLGESGIYFDPENSESLTNAIKKLIISQTDIQKLARSARHKATAYTWERCAEKTFVFLNFIAKTYESGL